MQSSGYPVVLGLEHNHRSREIGVLLIRQVLIERDEQFVLRSFHRRQQFTIEQTGKARNLRGTHEMRFRQKPKRLGHGFIKQQSHRNCTLRPPAAPAGFLREHGAHPA